MPTNKIEGDEWSEWLLHRRHANDPGYERQVRTDVEQYTNRVLDGAQLSSGMTLIDIGTGEGVVAFSAVERIGVSIRVILTDISSHMLHHAESIAERRGIRNQCTFLQCPADKLNDIADASVDAVTARAALAYVGDKRAAFREIKRVLKSGGRLSIAEPIFRDEALEVAALKKSIDMQPADSQDRFLNLLHRWKSSQFPDTDEKIAASPIANFSERDLVSLAYSTGFTGIRLEFHVDITLGNVRSWNVLLSVSPHPWAPSLNTIMAEQFSPDDRELFEQILRPIVESGQFISSNRVAFLTAKKDA